MSDSKTIFEVYAGSLVCGLNTPTSDVDIRGVYAEDYKRVLSGMFTLKPKVEPTGDTVHYELGHFTNLCCKGSITVVELLYTPREDTIHVHPAFYELIDRRSEFLPATWGSIFRFVERKPTNPKKVANALRMALYAEQIATEGNIRLFVPEPQNALLRRIRAGMVSDEECSDLLDEALAKIEALRPEDTSPLNPEDYIDTVASIRGRVA